MKKEKSHKAAIIFICVLTIPVVLYSLVLFAPSILYGIYQYGAIAYYRLTAKERYLVEGTFQGQEKGMNYVLEIQAITEEEFQNYDGKNTVEDTSKDRKNKYYYVQLYSKDEQEVVTNYTFINLKDYRKNKIRANYEDDNGKRIDYYYNDAQRCQAYLVCLSYNYYITFNYQ